MPGVPRRDRPAGARRVPDLPVRAASADDLPRHRQAAAGPLWPCIATAGSTCGRYWQPDFNAEDDRPADEYAARAARAADLGGRDAAAERRAAGGVSLRRGRFDDHRRADAAALPASRCGRSRSAFRCRSTTKRATPGWRPSGSAPIHEEFRVEPDAVEVLPKLVWHYDEPFADSSAVPTWYVSQADAASTSRWR